MQGVGDRPAEQLLQSLSPPRQTARERHTGHQHAQLLTCCDGLDDVPYFSLIRGGGLDLVKWQLPHDHKPPYEATMSDDTSAALGALQIDGGKLRGHVDEVVRLSVEQTLNGFWMPKRSRSAGHNATSVRRKESIAERVITSANWGPK